MAIVTCRNPCWNADGKPLCRVCEEQERSWGEAMAALIDDGPEPAVAVAPGELGHIVAEEA